MVPRGGIEPPTQGFSVILKIKQDNKFKKVLLEVLRKIRKNNKIFLWNLLIKRRCLQFLL